LSTSPISGGDSIRKKLEKTRSAQKPLVNKKLMEKQHPRQITGSKTPNNNAINPSFKKKLD
jgi:hypothetical protein